MMTKNLFENFSEVSPKEWKQRIQVDLKGADYNEALVYHSHEHIDIKPFYHREDSTAWHIADLPTDWNSCHSIQVMDAGLGNKEGMEAIERGAEALVFHIKNEKIDFSLLIQNIPDHIYLFINLQFLSQSYIEDMHRSVNANKKIFLLMDIIGNLAMTGNWYFNFKKDHEIFKNCIQKSTGFKSNISIDIGQLQNAGATIIQQLAYGLAHANEYLNYLMTFNDKELTEKTIVFQVAIGNNYFFEIAKLRALRILWKILSGEYNLLKKCYIFAKPTLRNKTVLDYNVNMLRTTTECMSAILGGADTVQNLSYDHIYHNSNDFGDRIAINQLLILKNESYFDKVQNPSDGCYYIESLTQQFAEKALNLFKNIEKSGGYLKQLKEGTLQRKIRESAEKEQKLFDTKEIILTGVNAFMDPDNVIPKLEKPIFFQKKERKTLLNPIALRRLSEKTEKKLINYQKKSL